ncbi:MAG: ATP-dependent sacrificial sulfur transferase LarE [Planctomycetota bacterium]|nr:ATP-dependent sacrificial sulfur transferase LarE [Planctomycetota bacterium]
MEFPLYSSRLARLERLLAALDGVAVAFSGGVDSAVLLHAARRALGERAVGVIADSPSLPRKELAEARAVAARIGARLEVVATDELSDPRYRANRGDRCYFCKQALFRALEVVARRHDLRTMAFGEITDDLRDDRPGARAARELGVRAPLREAGMGKQDVRRYAREHDLGLAEKPAAACLASRIPVGTPVTAARLGRVEEAEEAVRGLGFRVLRVRDHGAAARLEVGSSEVERARSLRAELAAVLAPNGFETVEIAAYRAPGT